MINVTKTNLPEFSSYVKYLEKIWQNNWVTNKGEFSLELEKRLKDKFEIENLSVVVNATVGLEMALQALGVDGGEVITTPFTFPATVNSIIKSGCKPIFADINPKTFNIDPKSVLKNIKKNTKAILAVHVFGNPCQIDELEAIAKESKIELIFDAAHAFDVEYKKKSILHYGDANVLSFHAAKVFHTIEGGSISMKDKSLQEKVDLIRNHGIAEYKETVNAVGTNGKMNEMQAIMGLCNLEEVDELWKKRKTIYEKYSKTFNSDKRLQTQKLSKDLTKYNYPYFPILFKDNKTRDLVYLKSLEHNIRPRKYFYPSANLYSYFKTNQKCPISENISARILCLPLYADLENKYVDEMISIVLENAG